MSILDILRRHRQPERRLTYCYHRCECGALYAVDSARRAWDCSDIILGRAIPGDQPGSVRHGDTMPCIFWKVKEAPLDWALKHRVER